MNGKRILLIITGSIAAYKSLELIRLLTKSGCTVEGVLTRGGAQFITPLSVSTLTGKKAHKEMWDADAHEMNHIELSRRSDLIVVAPATADFIGKIAQGLADDLASSVLLARNKPVMIAPSMNVEMWENAAFQRNLSQIKEDGVAVIPPQTDILACGESGIGKMAEPETINEKIEKFFADAEMLEGRRAIVTTGGTIEPIDSVRYISNFSSGKQGNAVALALAKAGAEVELVAGNVSDPLPTHPKIRITKVSSADEMNASVHGMLPADIFISCAAVCDFKVVNRLDRKIKKQEGLELKFEQNPDIARSVGELPLKERPSLVVGFAAETDNLIENAKKKLLDKGCDMIVANHVGNGAVFGKNENQASFVTEDNVKNLDTMSKAEVGRKIAVWIVENIEKRLG